MTNQQEFARSVSVPTDKLAHPVCPEKPKLTNLPDDV